MGDDLDVVAQVVEYQDSLAEHEDGFWHTLWVFGHHWHPWLEVPDGVVGHVAHGPAVEPWQPVNRDELVLRHLFFDERERVGFSSGFSRTGGDDLVRAGTDETVSTQAFAALHTLQKVGVGALSDFQIGRHRRFKIGVYRTVNRHQVAFSCPGLHLLESRVVHIALQTKRLVRQGTSLHRVATLILRRWLRSRQPLPKSQPAGGPLV